MGYWDIIAPTERTNMVLNPVAAAAGNYASVGANTTIARSSTYKYFGRLSYSVIVNPATDNSGITLTLAALTNADHYVSLRVRGTLPTAWDWSLDNATYNAPTLLSTEGDWSVYGYEFPAAQANGSTTLYIYTNGAYACSYYIGHAQVELTGYTTPITGDLKGFTERGYYWVGTANGSASVRTSQERHGGTVYDLEDDYDFRVLYGIGSGMPPIVHNTQSMALLPGALFQGYRVMPRVIDLISGTLANSSTTVAGVRKDFIDLIKPDLTTPAQPTVFQFRGNTTKPVKLYGYYDSGMEYNLNDGVVDKPTVRFICYDPFAYEVHHQAATLTTSASVANADYVVRKVDGVWYNVSTDFGLSVSALCRGSDGSIYIGGNFINVGDGDGDHIVKWNPFTSTLSSLSTGASDLVRALIVSPNGNVYLGGAFTDLGDAAGDRIAYWNGSSFNSLTADIDNGTVLALCFDQSGNLYVGGSFTAVVDANGNRITKWNGTAFSSLGSGGDDGTVYAIAVHPNGDIYATGTFTGMGGVGNTAYIARWDGSTWYPLGTGLSGGAPSGQALAIDKAGNVYVGGDFTTADGVSCACIAKWNGQTFEPLGSGLNTLCYSLAIDENGLLYAGGSFTSAGGITLSDGVAVWNGSTWAHIDINLPSTPIVYSILPVNNDLYIGYSTDGTATSSYLNTVTNSGTASAYPVIKVNRSGGTTAVLEWIKNETTGETLWCNYSLLDGETLTIDLTPGNRSITSSMFGDVWRAVLRSSDLSSFHLQPGDNEVSVFVNPTGAPTVTAWMEWQLTHWGVDMVAA